MACLPPDAGGGSVIALRFPRCEDAEELAEAVRESLDDLIPWMEWASESYDVAFARGWIEAQEAKRESGSAYEFLITDAAGAILGSCGVNRITAPPLKIANLGYWVRSSAAGQGIGPEAARRLAAWAFENTRLVRLEIVVAVGNDRSRRVAEKAGAELEGVLRARLWTRGPQDAWMYSLIRPSPLPSMHSDPP